MLTLFWSYKSEFQSSFIKRSKHMSDKWTTSVECSMKMRYCIKQR